MGDGYSNSKVQFGEKPRSRNYNTTTPQIYTHNKLFAYSHIPSLKNAITNCFTSIIQHKPPLEQTQKTCMVVIVPAVGATIATEAEKQGEGPTNREGGTKEVWN